MHDAITRKKYFFNTVYRKVMTGFSDDCYENNILGITICMNDEYYIFDIFLSSS